MGIYLVLQGLKPGGLCLLPDRSFLAEPVFPEFYYTVQYSTKKQDCQNYEPSFTIKRRGNDERKLHLFPGILFTIEDGPYPEPVISRGQIRINYEPV